jgi:hypothetical protein
VTLVATIVGVALIAVAARDVFDTLFHPHGRGVVSERVIRGMWGAWHALARGRADVLSYAGPTAFLIVVLSWVTLVVLGFALIIVPHLPEEYVLAAGLDPEGTSGFVDAIYVSLVSMTSLGYGDVSAESDALRLLGPAEAMIGLGILTASISWILSIYAVLADYRSVSHEIALLGDAERETGIGLSRTEPSEAARTLAGLASKLVAARRDLLHFPIAYYFHTRDPRYTLAAQLPRLLTIVEECNAAHAPAAVRLEAARVLLATDDFLGTIEDEFLRGRAASRAESIARYQQDHLWDASEASRSRATPSSS